MAESKKKLNLEKINPAVKKISHLITSILLTPIAIPYFLIGSFDRNIQYGSQCPEANYDIAQGFFEDSKFLNFWAKGFDNFYNKKN